MCVESFFLHPDPTFPHIFRLRCKHGAKVSW